MASCALKLKMMRFELCISFDDHVHLCMQMTFIIQYSIAELRISVAILCLLALSIPRDQNS